MPWYIWLLLVLVIGSVIGGLLILRDSANKMPISKDKLERMKQREEEQKLKDKEFRN